MLKQSILFLTIILMTASTQVLAWPWSAKRVHRDKLLDVDLGMTKKQVIKLLGKPLVKRGCQVDQMGKNTEVYEYNVGRGITNEQIFAAVLLVVLTIGLIIPFFLFVDEPLDTYWFYFTEDKLTQWGKSGDWKRSADVAYDINFGRC